MSVGYISFNNVTYCNVARGSNVVPLIRRYPLSIATKLPPCGTVHSYDASASGRFQLSATYVARLLYKSYDSNRYNDRVAHAHQHGDGWNNIVRTEQMASQLVVLAACKYSKAILFYYILITSLTTAPYEPSALTQSQPKHSNGTVCHAVSRLLKQTTQTSRRLATTVLS